MRSSAENLHFERISELQDEVKRHFEQRKMNSRLPPLSLKYGSNSSYTMRSKSYKKDTRTISCGALNRILDIDLQAQHILVEPRLSMEKMVQATLPYGFTVPVIPEVRSMTVGGAIMGMAGESSSHHWGCLHDVCEAFELLCGNGEVLHVSPQEHPDIFYGMAGSYGSLGTMLSAQLKLIPAKKYVHLYYHRFSNSNEAIEALKSFYKSETPPDYLEGIVFSKDCTIIAVGMNEELPATTLPILSLNAPSSKWYYQHVYDLARDHRTYEELMPLEDYFFRHDRGAFWMGAYLLHPSLLARFVGQGMLKLHTPKQNHFTDSEISKYPVLNSNRLIRTLMCPWMNGLKLSQMLHLGEKWVQDRFIVQDFTLPEVNASQFLADVIKDPGIFPIWICPLKGTSTAQIFAPNHINHEKHTSHFINLGLYGLPSYSIPIQELTRKLEAKTLSSDGRKVLYSHSYYSESEFWQIYPRDQYEQLRLKTHAEGMWHGITEKVLSS